MANRRLIDVDDLFRMKIVDEPDVDPSGNLVAFTVTRLDKEANAYRAQIYVHDLKTGDSRPLTTGDNRDTQPKWSPDGRTIAFISDRATPGKKLRRIWNMPANRGEAVPLTDPDLSIESFEWSPDSRRIAFVAAVGEPAASNPVSSSDVRVIDTARFRFDGRGFLHDKYRQIFVLDVDTGFSRQVTSGRFEHTQVSWSPTGYELAFAGNRTVGWEFSRVQDIYAIRLPGGAIRKITDGNGAWSYPSWSPSGRFLAFYGTRRLQAPSPRTEVFTCRSTGRDLKSVTAASDLHFQDSSISDWTGYASRPPVWLSEAALASVVSDRGAVRLATIEVEHGVVTTLTPESGRVGAPCSLPDGGFLFPANNFTDPGELRRLTNDRVIETITGFNAGWRNQVEMTTPEPLSARSPDGEIVHGWLLLPTSSQQTDPSPLLLQIHGGPFGMYADTMMHEFHLLASKGYAVVFCNPRGSAGYGDRFAAILSPEWGENDLPDLLAMVDAALDRGGLDENQMGVLGGSYGGFMTNWVMAQTDRFRAAVTQRTLSDLYSAWGTDDIFFADGNTTFEATPWEDPELFHRLSPITYVEEMVAPMLIIHSEQDYRCPIGQAEQLFVALKRLGRTTELVRFPDESHGLSRTGKPAHRVERLAHILRWFATYLPQTDAVDNQPPSDMAPE